MKPDFQKKINQAGFTLAEAMVATLIVALLFTSLYSGISYGFTMINLARENLRATQILQEKMETLRLYNWDQINTAGFIPTNFLAPYWDTNSGITSPGFYYTGSVSIANAPITESYSNDLRMVKVEVRWVSSSVPRVREMETFVSKNGLQNYVY